jgi:hypothetical protein
VAPVNATTPAAPGALLALPSSLSSVLTPAAPSPSAVAVAATVPEAPTVVVTPKSSATVVVAKPSTTLPAGTKVTGVVEAPFDHGVWLTVNVGHTKYKGMLFLEQCAVKTWLPKPVTGKRKHDGSTDVVDDSEAAAVVAQVVKPEGRKKGVHQLLLLLLLPC